MKRRTFLAQTAIAVAGSAALSNSWAQDKKAKPIGLQLYTVRHVIGNEVKDRNVKGTLKKLTDWGYKKFETYGYRDGMLFGMTSKDFSDYVRSLGAEITSGHYGMDAVRAANWEKTVSDAKEAGQEYLAVAYIGAPERTLDGYKKVCADINKAAEVTKQAGVKMAYHNHDFEFQKVGDQVAFDLMMSELDPKLVSLEMDIYWIVRGGQDPLKYFEKYPGRFEQWHVKDMDKTAPEKNADVGTGSIDFKPIFAQAKKSGMKHYYIEHDNFPGDPMQSAQKGIEYLKTIV